MSTTSWIDGPLLGFDTETTGTNVANDRIVTVALVHSVGAGRENETVATWLIDPGVEIPEPAQRVHGISTEHAREHGMQPAAALDEVATMIAEALAKDVPLVAFNISFDLAILENELTRLGLRTLTERLGHDIAPVIDGLVVDRGVDRYRKGKRTLTDVLAHYGLEQDGRLHTADVDVSAKYPQVAFSSLEDLHREQVGWHRRWAEGMNEWLTKKGKTPDVNTAWPL
jgi:DNA polymerase-3 subunit epsilon